MPDLPLIPDRDPSEFERITELARPAVFRGVVACWPAVAAGRRSAEQLRSYLLRFDRGSPVEAFVATPEVGGRFFYSDDMTGFNFQRGHMRLSDATAMLIAEAGKDRKNGIYVGSAPIAEVIPAFGQENALPLLDGKPADARIWIGNGTTVAAHWDASSNIACVVSGRRRFTLFPPDQVRNLYVGPIDRTVAGLPTSMVDLGNPDFSRYPRFRAALETAMVAELEPGDAIYIPALWWHHVQAFGTFNTLVNYWWLDGPPETGAALAAIAHGIMTIAALPEAQRDGWREMFDYYVFRRHGDPAEHIPEHARGVLAQTTPAIRRSIKDFLLRILSQ